MRDEAVASQDQDPTTEPAPAGEAPAGKGTGSSDASETIVSGSHAAGTPDNARPADTAPAEHEAWEAEFAGLTGSDAADPGTAAEAAEPGAASDAASSGAASDAAGPGAAADVNRRAPAGKATGQAEVPGGHPSLAQRSTLPMRAASTMPNLSRYDSAEPAGPAEDTGTETSAAAASGAAAAAATGGIEARKTADQRGSAAETGEAAGITGDQGAGANGVEAGSTDSGTDRGPWYVSGTAPSETDAGKDTGQDAEAGAGQDEEAQRRSLERERAADAKPVLARIIQVSIAVFFPVMLLAAAIRAVATPMFLWVEYYRPGFPADTFGFSAEDRMTYGSYAVDYLLNFASPRYLGDLVTPDGDPLYLASEVSHMADVKMVLGIAFLSAVGMALLSIAGGIYLARRCPGGIRRALFAGALATLALIAGLLVAAVLAWEQFFTRVHSIFFSQGNWTFRLDDTLIRLFPSQFWMDAGGSVAAIVLLACVITLIFTWPTKTRRERSRLAREATRRRYLESLDSFQADKTAEP
ncbi:DUF1461 domain-containing protein [Arthrobacter sp. Helios]|uniref:DUF1461 domain-containing protein n=1 Tax=Arthrobacter sp. Helios TaxID=2828862 RepID=UPI0020642DC9|nr:DUF1461 domain-containing protein [Arthrobacter sp. Helios]UPO77595.1 DUF1461 domain-containing protein [Arthrobacter sp. Helios]